MTDIISKNNISIRQAIVEDFEFSERPKLFITDEPLAGDMISLIKKVEGVKVVLIY